MFPRLMSIVRWSVVGAILVMLSAPSTYAALSGQRMLAVDGASMSPTYEFGDLIFSGSPSPDDFQVGTAVTVRRADGSMYTHRIVSISGDRASLKGDGNLSVDPTTIGYSDVVGVVRGHLAAPLGAVVIFSQTWPARVSLVIVVLALTLWPAGVPVSSVAAAATVLAPIPVTRLAGPPLDGMTRAAFRRGASAPAPLVPHDVPLTRAALRARAPAPVMRRGMGTARWRRVTPRRSTFVPLSSR